MQFLISLLSATSQTTNEEMQMSRLVLKRIWLNCFRISYIHRRHRKEHALLSHYYTDDAQLWIVSSARQENVRCSATVSCISIVGGMDDV